MIIKICGPSSAAPAPCSAVGAALSMAPRGQVRHLGGLSRSSCCLLLRGAVISAATGASLGCRACTTSAPILPSVQPVQVSRGLSSCKAGRPLFTPSCARVCSGAGRNRIARGSIPPIARFRSSNSRPAASSPIRAARARIQNGRSSRSSPRSDPSALPTQSLPIREEASSPRVGACWQRGKWGSPKCR